VTQKTAVISGITGQDGSYLAEFLLEKGYKVVGIRRRTSTFNTERLEPFYNHPNFITEWGNITDSYSLYRIVNKYNPDEIYNLAAMSHVKVSFDVPEETLDTVAKGTLHLLNIIKEHSPLTKFYQASSSEMFGVATCPWHGFYEASQMEPASPYACAKLYAHNLVKNYRAAYGLHLSSGILFNHESPRRGETFVTLKPKEIGDMPKTT
jgi:GDPmannose 4,6-dehydratase